jgi:hypothetical protein
MPRLGEQLQEFAVAAADVEHPRTGLHHIGDHHEVEPRRFRHGMRNKGARIGTGEHLAISAP